LGELGKRGKLTEKKNREMKTENIQQSSKKTAAEKSKRKEGYRKTVKTY